MLDTEYDFLFSANDEEPQIKPYEYMVLYNSIMGDLKEDLKKKERVIKYAKKDIEDIQRRIDSIHNAKLRAFRAEGSE